MPTLFQILFGRKQVAEQPLESKIFNPLDLRVGNALKINTLELERLGFNLKALREVTCNIGNEKHSFVDYDLVARPFGSEPVSKRLRLVPANNDVGFDVALIEKIGECGWNDEGTEDFIKSLDYNVHQGVFTEGEGDDQVTFWRINDVQSEYKGNTLLLADKDNSGKVDQNEVEKGELTYWDYWREFEEAGNKLIEFYFVELDQNGYVEFWRGRQLDPNRVEVA